MTKARLERVQTVLQHRQTDVAVLLDQVHKEHNLSAILRTCDAVGIPEIHALETTKSHLRIYNNATSGSQKWVNLTVHNTRDAAFNAAKANDRIVYAAHLSKTAIDYREADFTKPCVILMGAEKPGVSTEAAERADQHIIVPMHGMVESLNVSVAAAVILYELQRQRLNAGLYDKTQLDEATLKRLTFEWLQPKMARYCQANQLPYPDLDEDGDLQNMGPLTSQE